MGLFERMIQAMKPAVQSRPQCRVCGRAMVRNNSGQVLEYCSDLCRSHRHHMVKRPKEA